MVTALVIAAAVVLTVVAVTIRLWRASERARRILAEEDERGCE